MSDIDLICKWTDKGWFGNKYSKGKQVSNPFWLEAISGTKLPKGLTLVQQNNSATQNSNVGPKYFFIDVFIKK